jgi:hypothetical protein
MNTEPTAPELLEQIKTKCAVALLTKGYIPPVIRCGSRVVDILRGTPSLHSMFNFVAVHVEGHKLYVWGMHRLQPYDLRWDPDHDD